MIALFQANPALFALACGLLGLLVGSFLTVVIYRLPLMMDLEFQRDYQPLLEAAGETVSDEKLSFFRPAARCSSCKSPLGVFDTLPLISYFLLAGKCRSCKQAIPTDIPVVEVLTAFLFGLAAARFGPTLLGVGAMIYIALLVAMAAIDAKTMLLPDALTLPGLWLGLLASVFIGFTTPSAAIIGAAVGYGFPAITAGLFAKIRGRRGMGHGDFKLFAMIGGWLGWSALPPVFVVGFTLAIFGFITRALLHRGDDETEGGPELSFGPYLAAAGIGILLRPEWVAPLFI